MTSLALTFISSVKHEMTIGDVYLFKNETKVKLIGEHWDFCLIEKMYRFFVYNGELAGKEVSRPQKAIHKVLDLFKPELVNQ